jgi:hypothetical protein
LAVQLWSHGTQYLGVPAPTSTIMSTQIDVDIHSADKSSREEFATRIPARLAPKPVSPVANFMYLYIMLTTYARLSMVGRTSEVEQMGAKIIGMTLLPGLVKKSLLTAQHFSPATSLVSCKAPLSILESRRLQAPQRHQFQTCGRAGRVVGVGISVSAHFSLPPHTEDASDSGYSPDTHPRSPFPSLFTLSIIIAPSLH